jgi:hypothetical protein
MFINICFCFDLTKHFNTKIKDMSYNEFETINHIHINKKSSSLKKNTESKALKTIMLLVVLQISYVVFDLLEATTRNRVYGVVAGFFMIFFGLCILIISILTYMKRKSICTDLLFEFLQGFVYVSVGTAITAVRWTNKVYNIIEGDYKESDSVE